MNNKRELAKYLSLLLCIALVITSLFGYSFPVLAEGEDEYIEIRTVEDLYNIRNNMSGIYKLMNDIDLSEATSSGGAYSYKNQGWNPIGSNNDYSATPFTGILDGQGYSIKGLKINVSATKREKDFFVGLFAYNSGHICNIKFTDINISANCSMYFESLYVGSVSGKNDGVISNVIINNGSITGILKADNKNEWADSRITSINVSGISGSSTGTIEYCVNKANLVMQASDDRRTGKTGDGYLSGIAFGGSTSIINYCCNKGNISSTRPYTFTGESFSSGIDGGYSIISNSYNTASNVDYGITRSGKTNSCYFIGNGKTNTNATNCYFNGSGVSQSGWTKLSTEKLSDKNAFVGFDFDNVWFISNESEYKYPQLRSIENEVTKIELLSGPTNEIVVGTELVYEGAVARIYRMDGSTEDVELTPNNTTGGSTDEAGTKTVTFTYEDVSVTFDIEVIPVAVKSLEIASMPTKTSYVEGEAFDPTGLTVNAVYNNGETLPCTEYQLSAVDTKVGEKTVTITYGEVSTTFNVTYTAKENKQDDKTNPNNGNNGKNGNNSNGSSNNNGSSQNNKSNSNKKYKNEWVDGKWYDSNGKQSYKGTLKWKKNSVGWWVEDSKGWYPQSQWQKIDGIWYYFKPDGYMASNEWYNGYWLGDSGSWTYKYKGSWKHNGKGWWYGDTSGWYAKNQWQKIDGDWYYFNSSGYMVVNQYVDGYWLGIDGTYY